MSNYKSLIDQAMATAAYRLNAGVEKTASFTESSIIKEASELANALEYMSISEANDGSLTGTARAELIRDFHKAATAQRLGTKLAGDVGESSTDVDGTQLIAPESGKIKLMPKKEVNGNPMVTSSPDSKGKTMLESFKQADSGSTLYDILVHQKEAGDVGEYAADQYMSITSANENSNRSLVDDSSILNYVTKQEAKAPVRDRLREAFASTSDTLGDQTVKGMFPHAYQASGLRKTASAAYVDEIVESFMADLGLFDPVVKEAGKRKQKQKNKGINEMKQMRSSLQSKIMGQAKVDVARAIDQGKSRPEIEAMLKKNYDGYVRKAGSELKIPMEQINERFRLAGKQNQVGRKLDTAMRLSGDTPLLNFDKAFQQGEKIISKGRLKYYKDVENVIPQGAKDPTPELFPETKPEVKADLDKQLQDQSRNVQKMRRNTRKEKQRQKSRDLALAAQRRKERKAMTKQQRRADRRNRINAAAEARQEIKNTPPPRVFQDPEPPKPTVPTVVEKPPVVEQPKVVSKVKSAPAPKPKVKATTGLSTAGKAGILGTALLGGMAAKQIVHNRKKQYMQNKKQSALEKAAAAYRW